MFRAYAAVTAGCGAGITLHRADSKPKRMLRGDVALTMFALLLSSSGMDAYGATAATSADQPRSSKRSTVEANGPRETAPGVRIDWQRRSVEVAARVVLKKGVLELFACSPHTREHESVITVTARPLHVFQAMGLVGLEPGSPVRYDEQRERWLPPEGEVLRLRVRYDQDGIERSVPLEHWMVEADSKKPPRAIRWVFSGSRSLTDGRFGADVDGTVIAVVDFDTALVAVSALHTADNTALWLAVNSSAVPPPGTACELIIRSASAVTKEYAAELTPQGMFRVEGKDRSAAELARLLNLAGDKAGETVLTLIPAESVRPKALADALGELVAAGLGRELIEVRPMSEKAGSAGPD